MAAWPTGAPCLAALLVSALALAVTEDARALFTEGVRLEKEGRLPAARAAYQKALAMDPKLVPALANLGMVELRMGQAPSAVQRFREVLKINPQLAQVEFYLGLALYESADYAAAASALEHFRRSYAGDPRAMHLHALCLLKLDRLAEGVSLLEQSVRRNQDNLAGLVTLATSYIALQRLEEASQLLHGPLKDLQSPEALLARGMLLNAQGRYLEAEKALRDGLALNPKLPTLRSQLGYTLMLLGDYPAAAREFEAELSWNPHDFGANANLGWILLKDRHYEHASKVLGAALQLKPASTGVQFLLGQVHFSSGDMAKARGLLEKVVLAKPDFRAAHVLLARVYAKLRMPDELARTQSVIQRLTQDEQARNAGGTESYGGRVNVPEFAPRSGGPQ